MKKMSKHILSTERCILQFIYKIIRNEFSSTFAGLRSYVNVIEIRHRFLIWAFRLRRGLEIVHFRKWTNVIHFSLILKKKKKGSNIEVANSIQYCKKEISVLLLPHPNMVSFIINGKSKNNLSIITLVKCCDNSLSTTYVRFFCTFSNYLGQLINDSGSLC